MSFFYEPHVHFNAVSFANSLQGHSTLTHTTFWIDIYFMCSKGIFTVQHHMKAILSLRLTCWPGALLHHSYPPPPPPQLPFQHTTPAQRKSFPTPWHHPVWVAVASRFSCSPCSKNRGQRCPMGNVTLLFTDHSLHITACIKWGELWALSYGGFFWQWHWHKHYYCCSWCFFYFLT